MGVNQSLSRRCFLWSGVALGAAPVILSRAKNETVYRFATPKWDVQMIVEFYNRYSSSGFWFDDRRSGRRFCFSSSGEQSNNCLTKFSGSIAVAQYRVRPRSAGPGSIALREHVRTVDWDDRLSARPPFDDRLALRKGIASDIQAFGYESDDSPLVSVSAAHEPWCLLRQDLYFDEERAPFLVLHWKHALSAIRLIDVIPGDQTRMVKAS